MMCASLATPGTQACAAGGGEFRPEDRDWPSAPAGGSTQGVSFSCWGMVLAVLIGFSDGTG